MCLPKHITRPSEVGMHQHTRRIWPIPVEVVFFLLRFILRNAHHFAPPQTRRARDDGGRPHHISLFLNNINNLLRNINFLNNSPR